MTQRPKYTSSYRDRHGALRWRFRRMGVQCELPGQPGEPAFERAYQDAMSPGRAMAEIVPLRTKTLKTAWLGVQKSLEWKDLSETSQMNQRRQAEKFLQRPLAPGATVVWGDVPIDQLRRQDIKALLAEMSDTPHAADHVFRTIRKLSLYALDEGWIENDPTYRIRYSPELKGHRAWRPEELAAFEARWPTGSTPRLAYALARYTGSRRSDIARIRWDDFRNDRFEHAKTGIEVILEILPALAIELAATRRRGPTVMVTQYGDAFSPKSMTTQFRKWARAAGLDGCTLHGLRKTLGGELADEGATTKQIQAVLGHKSLQQAELYTRSADRRRNAREGLALLRKSDLKSGK